MKRTKGYIDGVDEARQVLARHRLDEAILSSNSRRAHCRPALGIYVGPATPPRLITGEHRTMDGSLFCVDCGSIGER